MALRGERPEARQADAGTRIGGVCADASPRRLRRAALSLLIACTGLALVLALAARSTRASWKPAEPHERPFWSSRRLVFEASGMTAPSWPQVPLSALARPAALSAIPASVTGGSLGAEGTVVWPARPPTSTLTPTGWLPLVVRWFPPPAWRQAAGSDDSPFAMLAVCDSDPRIQYAAARSNGIYRSSDGGTSWERWVSGMDVDVVVIHPGACNRIYASNWGQGVYSITAAGASYVATPINTGLTDLYLYGLLVQPDGSRLLAGTNASGLFRTPLSSIRWQAVNSGIQDLRIRSLYYLGPDAPTVFAGARTCHFYTSTNWGNSWSESTVDVVSPPGCGDAQVWALLKVGNVVYAGLGLERGLYRQEGAGAWVQVAGVPTQTNIYRYGLLEHNGDVFVSAYGQGVYRCPGAASSCQPLPNGGLGSSGVRGLAIARLSDEQRLLVATDDGIWWVPLE